MEVLWAVFKALTAAALSAVGLALFALNFRFDEGSLKQWDEAPGWTHRFLMAIAAAVVVGVFVLTLRVSLK